MFVCFLLTIVILGTAVVTDDKAALWTDGRYFLQVRNFRHIIEYCVYAVLGQSAA